MVINFDEFKKQNIDINGLVRVMELIYNENKKNNDNSIIFNEYVQVLHTSEDEYEIKLEKSPLSESDITIVSEDGAVIITPIYITKLEQNIVTIKSSKISSATNFFVTYKY